MARENNAAGLASDTACSADRRDLGPPLLGLGLGLGSIKFLLTSVKGRSCLDIKYALDITEGFHGTKHTDVQHSKSLETQYGKRSMSHSLSSAAAACPRPPRSRICLVGGWRTSHRRGPGLDWPISAAKVKRERKKRCRKGKQDAEEISPSSPPLSFLLRYASLEMVQIVSNVDLTIEKFLS